MKTRFSELVKNIILIKYKTLMAVQFQSLVYEEIKCVQCKLNFSLFLIVFKGLKLACCYEHSIHHRILKNIKQHNSFQLW